MTARRRTAALLIVVLALAAPAAARSPADDGPVSDTETNPLRRAAFVALPAVYELQSTIRVEAVVVDGRRRAIARDVTFAGTAFGVGPGRVATARHLIAPPAARIAEELTLLGVPGLPDDDTALRVAYTPATTVTLLRSVSPDAADAEGRVPQRITGTVVETSDATGDVALLAIDDEAAPTLALEDEQTSDTPIALIGFGGRDALTAVPAVRLGAIGGAAAIAGSDDDRFGVLRGVDVIRGDSGGPVIDVEGVAHGLVIRRASGDTPPVYARVTVIRSVMVDNGSSPRLLQSTIDFAEAMATFWRRDYGTAAVALKELSTTYTDPVLVRYEARRAQTLATAGYRVDGGARWESAVLAIGVSAAVAAAALGIVRIVRYRPET